MSSTRMGMTFAKSLSCALLFLFIIFFVILIALGTTTPIRHQSKSTTCLLLLCFCLEFYRRSRNRRLPRDYTKCRSSLRNVDARPTNERTRCLLRLVRSHCNASSSQAKDVFHDAHTHIPTAILNRRGHHIRTIIVVIVSIIYASTLLPMCGWQETVIHCA